MAKMQDSEVLHYWLSMAQQGDPVACYNAGVLYQQQSDINMAIHYYEQAIALNPCFAEAYNNLGGIYKARNQHAEALNFYFKALSLKPDDAGINNNIGVIFQNKKLFTQSLSYFLKAHSLSPYSSSICDNLVILFSEQKKFSEALHYCKKSYELEPTVEHYWVMELTNIQKMYLDDRLYFEAIDRLRDLYQWIVHKHVSGSQFVGKPLPFYITYQEQNNLPFLSIYGDMCNFLMRNEQPILVKSANNPKIRIGIVSDDLHNHSVWNAVLKGWYQYIDENTFDIISFCLNDKKDNQYGIAKSKSKLFFENFQSVAGWVNCIKNQKIDILIYSAVGMSWKIQQLASLRLAPVQCTTWGHPESSGLPTIDYYLSAADFEPDNAQDYYREKLVLLPNLGSYYEPAYLEPMPFNIDDLNINPATKILISAGMPFKYDPSLDYMFADIAQLEKNIKIVFFEAKPEGLCDEFKKRIENVFNQRGLDLNNQVIFIPAMRAARFHSLMQQAHVYLDTIGFSGFNTAIQAIECNLPIVTLEGKFMRGRFGSALLMRLGLSELVTHSVIEYVGKVDKLIHNESYRLQVREKMLLRKNILYKDKSVIEKLQEFILSVVTR